MHMSLEAGEFADRPFNGPVPQDAAVALPPEKLPGRSKQAPESGVVQGNQVETLVVGGDVAGGLEVADVELVTDNERVAVHFLLLTVLVV